jgi:Zn-dependent M28 family amino/carboxypeptidase
VLALWDTEEIGLRGAQAYVADLVFPLGQTVAALNVDLQGSNLLSSLATTTIMVGVRNRRLRSPRTPTP